MEDLE
jgi:hypothetical protein